MGSSEHAFLPILLLFHAMEATERHTRVLAFGLKLPFREPSNFTQVFIASVDYPVILYPIPCTYYYLAFLLFVFAACKYHVLTALFDEFPFFFRINTLMR